MKTLFRPISLALFALAFSPTAFAGYKFTLAAERTQFVLKDGTPLKGIEQNYEVFAEKLYLWCPEGGVFGSLRPCWSGDLVDSGTAVSDEQGLATFPEHTYVSGKLNRRRSRSNLPSRIATGYLGYLPFIDAQGQEKKCGAIQAYTLYDSKVETRYSKLSENTHRIEIELDSAEFAKWSEAMIEACRRNSERYGAGDVVFPY